MIAGLCGVAIFAAVICRAGVLIAIQGQAGAVVGHALAGHRVGFPGFAIPAAAWLTVGVQQGVDLAPA